ncbi:hypothetical protein G3N55_09690 [Dissulfurirhabdus thermomarina]|uniref:Outer membrane protein assembly factor BamE n=1 Tax=Dissulfurirhabdus thermomarina TaxID=1765737 RepID=A0A6N9TPA9_DISTH|nr:hypothetical protein [Dissulfurirhabdus thermomarina]NDY43111.1 hypothetical protein [Dissulfurirhabdus thermomarina]NMX24447.1 hypothetical protein [Dissulfurirhabdus thermomarina]
MRIHIGVLFLLIGCLGVFLSSCSGPPRRFLVAEASLVRPGMPFETVTRRLGPPDASRARPTGEREWYYYETHLRFWHYVPLLNLLGGKEIDALQIVTRGGRVVKVVYYVPRS